MIKYSDLTTMRTKLRDVVPLDTPYALYIEPTNFCNFHCSFCSRNLDNFHDIVGECKHMDLKLFEKIISDVEQFPRKLKVLRLYYLGEPLLNPEFMDMFSIVCKSNCCERIELTTNGSMLSKDKSLALLKAAKHFEGDIYVRISVYAVEQEHFSYVTSNNMDVNIVKQNVSELFNQRNAGAISNVIIYAKKLKTLNEEDELFVNNYKPIVDEVALEEPMNWSGDGGEDNFLLKKEYSDTKLQAFDKGIVYPQVCSYLFTTLAIQSDGVVVVCCVDWSRKTKCGDVNKQSLQEIWHGDELKKLRLLHLGGRRTNIASCRNCKRMPLAECDWLDDCSVDIQKRL